ncbi:hypothetical protein BDF14DRAFT_1767933 [Spinellus fusiger]|nr:hypothetical protein BDF14DRAFT_1767933 [Spinellus fusiger]
MEVRGSLLLRQWMNWLLWIGSYGLACTYWPLLIGPYLLALFGVHPQGEREGHET